MEELIFGLIGGTALLMYGVDMMGDGLEKASGETMKKILTVLTGKVWSAFLVGIFVTAIVQSSTAVTVLTVGFVNSGLMKLSQAIGIIYGANIGTTITAQLMAFSFKFKLTDIALPVLGIGFGINSITKNKKFKNIGQAMMGFGMMFLGLKILNEGVPYMQQSESLRYFFTNYASIPVIAIFLGMCVTAMVHSSAATIGLVMVLSQAGLLDLQSSIYIILGDNIGTCFTAQLASMTGNINARRTAWAHTLYNVFGVLLALILMPVFIKIIIFLTNHFHKTDTNISAYIANSHTLFNSINALIFLPLTKYYVEFLYKIIRSKENGLKEKVILDKLLIDTPVAALEASRSEIIRGTEILKHMVSDVMNMIYLDDRKKIAEIMDNEAEINQMQKDLTRYIVEVSRRELTESQSIMVPAMISSINNIERSGDRVIEISSLFNKKIDGNLSFTDVAITELKELESSIIELFDNTIIVLKKRDNDIIKTIVELEDKIDEMSETFQENHIRRLNEGSCNVDSGVLFIDIVGHLERIADHIYKIAMYTKDELFGDKRKYN
ncbi:Na/Pi cotransporter family protein [Tissierella praeacuta]|uniref:Phosphate:Na+ symporter n=1 Tax=Tissierella praeacuta DSM 18095 TaxID=1123404 RepID=A0A1M4W6R7_9FIRM|nr:Na/Pi cotransporter family protein [Tissierella praeacuta]MBU5256138.1 Na/Pi cotransporter family protein [Tissierella praeacuta]TCU75595.1 phosphate:Na+ symporter [Tissierella praeacuta]SHE76783.1 phosphate:Na+ symporter [Tissierella praeacuta DSM 18095]SUP00033.1 Na/Pi-cotransporter II-related protein [Tissierella praeacuta]